MIYTLQYTNGIEKLQRREYASVDRPRIISPNALRQFRRFPPSFPQRHPCISRSYLQFALKSRMFAIRRERRGMVHTSLGRCLVILLRFPYERTYVVCVCTVYTAWFHHFRSALSLPLEPDNRNDNNCNGKSIRSTAIVLCIYNIGIRTFLLRLPFVALCDTSSIRESPTVLVRKYQYSTGRETRTRLRLKIKAIDASVARTCNDRPRGIVMNSRYRPAIRRCTALH